MAVIVDDNDMDRYLVRRVLSKHDIFDEVFEAPTGDAFIAEFCEGETLNEVHPKPVLILMDINMPGRNGFETAERLQAMVEAGQTTRSIVVMMFTSSDNPEDKARADAIDIVKGYIVKPLSHEDVETIISQHFQGHDPK